MPRAIQGWKDLPDMGYHRVTNPQDFPEPLSVLFLLNLLLFSVNVVGGFLATLTKCIGWILCFGVTRNSFRDHLANFGRGRYGGSTNESFCKSKLVPGCRVDHKAVQTKEESSLPLRNDGKPWKWDKPVKYSASCLSSRPACTGFNVITKRSRTCRSPASGRLQLSPHVIGL